MHPPLPPPHFNRRTLCELRPGSTGSLIELTFRMHGKDEGEPPLDASGRRRVPEGLAHYSLSARLSAVRLVFMQRFVNELLQYISGMLAMTLPPLRVPAWAEQYAAVQRRIQQEREDEEEEEEEAARGGDASGAKRSAEEKPSYVTPNGAVIGPDGQACMLLLLDVDLSAPLIVMPESSSSLACLEVDLGSARIRNRISWTAPPPSAAGEGGAAERQVLMDDLGLNLCDMGAIAVAASGRRGSNLIQGAPQGFEVGVGRPLVQVYDSAAAGATAGAGAGGGHSAPLAAMPPMLVSVAIPDIQARVRDSEYRLLLSVAGSNLAEKSQQVGSTCCTCSA